MTESTLYQVEDGWIELKDGVPFVFGAPTSDQINVETVAYALSRLCRYNGHTNRMYSVAEHTILMADYVEADGGSPQECLTALHHDDAEYIIGDLARPVKVKTPGFKAHELILDEAIARKFSTIYPFPKWMKDLDARIISDERRQFFTCSGNDWGTDGLKPLEVKFWNVLGNFSWPIRRAYLKRHFRWTAEMLEM